MNLFSFLNSVNKISPKAKEALEQITQVKGYSKNEIIQEIGSRCKTIYFVQEGCARIFYYKNGNDITEHFAFRNDLIVRAESLLQVRLLQKVFRQLNKQIL